MEREGLIISSLKDYLTEFHHNISFETKLDQSFFLEIKLSNNFQLSFQKIENKFFLWKHKRIYKRLWENCFIKSFDTNSEKEINLRVKQEIYKFYGYDKSIDRTKRGIYLIYWWMKNETTLPRDVILVICRKVFETRFIVTNYI